MLNRGSTEIPGAFGKIRKQSTFLFLLHAYLFQILSQIHLFQIAWISSHATFNDAARISDFEAEYLTILI